MRHPTPPIIALLATGVLAGCPSAEARIFVIDSSHEAGEGTVTGQSDAGAGEQAGSSAPPEGGTGAAGSGGMAAVFPVAGDADPNLDPNVTFRWVETPPGHGTCEPKRFVGNFSCDVSPAVLSTHVEGSLMLDLAGSSESQVFSISMGQLMAFPTDDNTRLLVNAPVTGSLDCATDSLTGEVISTPTEVLPIERQLGWLLLNSQPDVAGALRGTFDARALTIEGDITLLIGTQTKCNGTFNLGATQ